MRIATLFVLTLILALQGRECRSLENFSYFIHYSVNQGLPSSRVFDVLQDSRGYLWIATENGVSRFNGYDFQNFTTKEGLPVNSTVRIQEDQRGRVWFMSYQGPLSYFEDGRIVPFHGNPELKRLNVSLISSMYSNEDGSMMLIPFNGGLIEVGSDSLVKPAVNQENPTDSVFIYLEKRQHANVCAFFNSFPGTIDASKKPGRISDTCWTFRLLRRQTDNHLNSVVFGEDILLGFGKKLYRVAEDRLLLVREFEDEIIALNMDRYGILWISVKFNGVYKFDEGPEKPADGQFLKGKTVSAIQHDREGNYWFSTTESGIYLVPSLGLEILKGEGFDTRDQVILTLELRNDDLFFSTDQKEVYHATVSGSHMQGIGIVHTDRQPINNVNAILCTADDKVYISADFQPELPDSIIKFRMGRYTVFPVEYGYSLHESLSGDILFGHFNGLQQIREDRILWDVSYDRKGARVFDAIQMPDSTILFGSIEGLIEMKDDRIGPVAPEDRVLGRRISKLRYAHGRLWVGSFDYGLVVIEGDSTYYIDESNGLSGNRIKSICLEDESTAWIGTNRGLSKISIAGTGLPVCEITTVDIWDGLPSNEINEIKEYNGLLWIATDRGIVSFNPDLLVFKHNPPVLVLDRIFSVPGEELSLQVPARLKHDQNSISIEFHAITFRNPRETVYRYRLEGLSEKWSETRNTSVRFHRLDPGSYTLHITARGSSGVVSEPVTYSFVVGKHITQTNGFLALVILVAGFLVFWVVRAVINVQKRRLELQRKIFLAEQKAMLAQMNPHFIFNSLNSIQNFILESDHVTANLYLVTFSSLIRKVLDASQHNFISLRDELDIVKLYLELEKFRFQGRFDYKLHLDESVNPDQVSIPSMILQPYLENAIWHGIMPKKGPGLVELEVARTGQHRLTITITDNGIGREKAREISDKRKQHIPTGMKNVEERLKLLNELNRTRLSVRVTDLHDRTGKGTGTRVEIEIDD